MNRAERRRTKRNDETLNTSVMYNKKELQEMLQKEREAACEFAFLYMVHFSILALRDEYSFGKQRLEKFIEKVFENYRNFDKDYVEVKDIRQAILDEVGIDIVLKGMNELEKK